MLFVCEGTNIVSNMKIFTQYIFFALLIGISFFRPCKGRAFNFSVGVIPPEKMRTQFSYTGLFHQKADFPQGEGRTQFQEFDLTLPIHKTETEGFSFNLKGNKLAVIPEQSEYSSFSELKASLNYTQVIDQQRQWSLSVRYGSASDKVFENSSVITYGATGTYSFPQTEKNRWLLLLDYANDRPILNNLPLPGFAYFYNPSKEFRGVFGVPFASINWNFAQSFSLDFMTVIPWVFKGAINYQLNSYSKIYSGFNFSQLTYYKFDRTNSKERVFFDEKKMFVGLKIPLHPKIFSEFELGHAFDRSIFKAESYQLNPDNPTLIGNAFYGKLNLLFLL